MKTYTIKLAVGVLQIVIDKKIISCGFVDENTSQFGEPVPVFIMRAINDFQKRNSYKQEFLNSNIEMNGTDFQKKVWQAIKEIPFGETCTYGEIAKNIGSPNASRAVGSACGANKIALFIPCHRVVGKNPTCMNYKWGRELKEKLLLFEKNSK